MKEEEEKKKSIKSARSLLRRGLRNSRGELLHVPCIILISFYLPWAGVLFNSKKKKGSRELPPQKKKKQF